MTLLKLNATRCLSHGRRKSSRNHVLRDVDRFKDKHRGGVPMSCSLPYKDLSISAFAYYSRMEALL
ncbi:hypothetical protein BJY01DRAFT_215227 [Aspergillus pseudoustus]|uniref:Uncharacterized protein n=1 Tax=Aspergillus pseudoustus TaxID=1810923 RepID=A0ABR4JVU7_9EURO